MKNRHIDNSLQNVSSEYVKELLNRFGDITKDRTLALKLLDAQSKITLDLIKALHKSHKESLLSSVMLAVPQVMKDKTYRGNVAFVYTSIALNKDQKDKLSTILRKKISNNIEIIFEVDNSLSGGILITYKDNEIDLTLESSVKDFIRTLSLQTNE